EPSPNEENNNDDASSFMAFLEEVKEDYQNGDPQLCTTLNKFVIRYNAAKSKSISRLSSFLYDINRNIDPMARVKSGVPIRVQIESIKGVKEMDTMKHRIYRQLQENVSWMINSSNPTPLAFFRITYPSIRGRALTKYSKTLSKAIEQTSHNKEHQEKLIILLKKFDDGEFDEDWEIWWKEKKMIEVHHNIQQANVDAHSKLNTKLKNQGSKRSTTKEFSDDDDDYEDYREIDSDEEDFEETEEDGNVFEEQDDNAFEEQDDNGKVLKKTKIVHEDFHETGGNFVIEDVFPKIDHIIGDETFPEINHYIEDVTFPGEDCSMDDTSWILKTGTNVSKVLKQYCEKIPAKSAFLYPAYFGVLDLSGEDVEVRNLFTNGEWEEMVSDFKGSIKLDDLLNEEQYPFFDLMDRMSQALKTATDDIITEIESNCVIKRLSASMSEGHFSSAFTNMITKGIMTYEQYFTYDEGEIQSLASAFVANMPSEPTERSIIGQKCDFRVRKDGFEGLIGLRSGGIPEVHKSKKWMDKVDLSVAMRDVLLKEGLENNGVGVDEYRKLFTLGVHSFGFNYNLYAMDWKANDLWRLCPLKRTKLPQSKEQLLIIEDFVTSLLRIEVGNRVVIVAN
ncbi:13869_t:CDS:10, partial [Cetraspora pellucida]